MQVVALASTVCLLTACTGDLFVSTELGPDAECKYTASAEFALDHVVYDISGDCEHPYIAHLLTENPSSDTVLVSSAEVTLATVQDQPLVFHDSDSPLPNPFLTTVMSSLFADRRGVVAVQVIPTAYAPYLDAFDGGELVATVQLFGETSDGDELESNLFSLQIEICDGCLTLCGSELTDRDLTIEDLLGVEQCDGSAETGGRVCVDPDC